uniref:spatacsin n=1 Tax=Euleptes europaea TaxID=460621 RepID=UPI0025418FFD|nr:spatacsin [Euleptes europaea]
MAGALPVLLLPLQAPPGPLARAQLSRRQEALALASHAGRELRWTGPGWEGGSRRPALVALPGACSDFVWENFEDNDPVADSLKLLTVSHTRELSVYEVSPKVQQCEATLLHSCSEDRLKKLIEQKNISVPPVSSLRVLSFENGRALLMLNSFVVVRLAFLGGGQEVEELEDCFFLDLSPQVLERIVDASFCRGIVVLLDESGWIYVFDAIDGTYLAYVDVALYQAEGQDEKNPDLLLPLKSFKVSHDLSVAVITNCSGYAAAVDLDLYFREYPGHLLCKRNFDNLPVEQLKEMDEEDLRSSGCSMTLVDQAFRTDRSWKAHLISLYETTKRVYSPNLVADAYLPWYQYCLRLGHHDCKIHEASDTSLLQDVAYVFSNARRKDHKESKERDRRWRNLNQRGLEDCVKTECKSVTGFSALFAVSSESEGLTLILWDLETQDIVRSHMGKNSFFVECSEEEQLCLVLSEPGLSLVLFGLTQEEFLNRLIIHGRAGTVDSLCRLNGWGRCSIPIHALEAGLENRQLDTVDFFLKNKENLFSVSPTCSLEEQTSDITSDFYLKSVEELRPALDLLCLAIQENDLEAQSKHFSEQLLSLTLSFLNKQLCEIFVHVEELDEHLDGCVHILTSYITKLRAFMIKFPRKQSSILGTPCDLEEDVPRVQQCQTWEQLSTEQIIANAILNNKLPEAQTFFRMTGNPAQKLEELTYIGLELACRSLQKGDAKEASKLLTNMGFDVMKQLHRICFYTSDQPVRDFLVKVLQEENYFSEAEKEMIDFVYQVENAYSGASQENSENTQSRDWRKKKDPSAHTAALDVLMNCNQDRVHNGEHRVMLNWAQSWDPVTREIVLLPTRSPEELKSCNPEVLWMHLSSWHDWSNISSWIADSQLQGSSTKWPALSTEALDRSTLCSYYMRNEILDSLARNGVFAPVELEDFKCLLQRLIHAGGVMQNPQPVSEYSSPGGFDFHACFILYCLDRGLNHLLYTYLDCYRLFSSNCPILGDQALHEAHPWFEFLVRCRDITSSPGDAEMIFQASLANAQILIPSNQASVSTMLLEGRTLLALATTMYAPGGIDQILQNGSGRENPAKKVDTQLFRMALTPYPKLKAALFSPLASHGVLPSDVSLYHLVQALVPFDSAKLFGWQPANSLAMPDVGSDLPHFSCLRLINKYAVIERLDFCYYLRHERPSFAFGAFLVQQLAKSKTPKQLVQWAGHKAYGLALSLFHVPSVAAACVCFLELLGLDSLKLRVDVKAANVILSFMSQREEPQHNSIRESLVEKLTELVEGERTAAEELLVCLEEAVWDKIEHQNIKKTSSSTRKQWSLVVQFCRLHNLKLNTSYLRECARSNEWLQFLIEAQMYDYQPVEVLAILPDFAPPLQDHLRLAFESLRAPLPWVGSQVSSPCLWRHEKKPGSPTGDLFHILLQCQSQPQPWRFLLRETLHHRVPVLSVLAACFQDANILHCLCIWIITSLDSSTAGEVTDHMEGSVETHEWDIQDLATLWQVLLRRQKVRTLLNGFQLFLKDSPLLTMLEVYELCMDYKNYHEAQTKLLELQASLSKLQATDEELPPILPAPWLKTQVAFLLELMLQQCRTQYELRRLLQILADTDTVLPHGPDMKKLSALCWILKDSSISISRAILSCCTPENLSNECRRILEQLQERSWFSKAREVAEMADLPVDHVVVQEMLQNLHLLNEIGHWPQKQTRVEFWKKCHENFVRNAVSNQTAFHFFSAQADAVSEPLDNERMSGIQERRLLLTLAGHWLASSDPIPLDELEVIERKIWLCHVAQHASSQGAGTAKHRFSHQISTSGELSFDALAKEFSFSKLPALSSPKYLQLEGLPSQDASQATLPDADVEWLSFLIGRLLDEGSVHEASRVCRYFDFYSRDLLLVLHCRALAAGEASRSCCHPQVQAVLAARAEEEEEEEGDWEPQNRHLQRASSWESWSFAGAPCSDDKVVGSLQALTAECVHGRNYCRQVLCLYELSKELGCSFSEISAQDSEKLLRALLSSQQPDRCPKAQAFITTQGLELETVAELVAEEVMRELLARSQGEGGQSQILDPAEESQVFLQLAKLCQDPTLVGMKLLDKISSVPHGELACTTELLILAHHCFSLTCHMEGITRVLQAARLLTDEHLAPNEKYGLMVRLLTGIGRYNEMTYIFDLLHEKHYFEVLMRKKLDPSGTLKTALLDYIKRCRPGDSEKHNMIALCFSMCREIGENHEAAANVQLKLIESQPWEESLQDMPNLKKRLMKALTLFIDAAESYSKDFCVRHSLRCNRLTKLITLQLHLLNSGRSTKLISLRRQDLLECIVNLPRFYQAAIVADAYDFVPDWSEVLYQQVIVKGDFSYLEEYKQRGLLKASTFEDIAQKLKRHPGSVAPLKNLKRLLTYCEDIYVYYKLAYDHQLFDVVTMLLQDPQTGCCLNDLLAN